MNKKILIGVNIIVFVLVIAGVYYFLNHSSKKTPGGVNTAPEENVDTYPKQPIIDTTKEPEIPAPTQGEWGMQIKTKDGGTISVNDFYKDSKTIVYKDWGAMLKVNPYYQILYFTIDQSFLISLLGGDLRVIRADAEKDLVNILGLTEKEACQLVVVVAVSNNASEKASGRDYNLSFCPDGTPLPKNL
jgi:hypothetical protein